MSVVGSQTAGVFKTPMKGISAWCSAVLGAGVEWLGRRVLRVSCCRLSVLYCLDSALLGAEFDKV